MNEKKLKKLEEKIRSLRMKAGSVRDRELVSLAQKLGRQRAKTDGHPQYVSDVRPGRVTIPSHSKPLKPATTFSILDELETDVFCLREESLRSQKGETSE